MGGSGVQVGRGATRRYVNTEALPSPLGETPRQPYFNGACLSQKSCAGRSPTAKNQNALRTSIAPCL